MLVEGYLWTVVGIMQHLGQDLGSVAQVVLVSELMKEHHLSLLKLQ